MFNEKDLGENTNTIDIIWEIISLTNFQNLYVTGHVHQICKKSPRNCLPLQNKEFTLANISFVWQGVKYHLCWTLCKFSQTATLLDIINIWWLIDIHSCPEISCLISFSQTFRPLSILSISTFCRILYISSIVPSYAYPLPAIIVQILSWSF